jgi:thermitase
MNSWPKILLSVSAVLCLISFGALGWLAFETTELTEAGSVPAPMFEKFQKKTGKEGGKSAMKTEAVAPAAVINDELTSKLAELNNSESVVPGELLLSFDSPEALNAFRTRAGLAGIEILYSDARLKVARVRYRDAGKMANELRDHAADYANVGPNYRAWVPGVPKEPVKDAANAGGAAPFESSGLEMIGANRDRSRWGVGVKVAVLDTGVTDHPDLAGVKITHTDLVKDGQPMHGHGTAMASLIAGRDAVHGGVAPASEILDVRVADSTGMGNTAFVAQGILYAVDSGARVINISLGAAADSTMLREAVAYAISRGVTVVAAGGNEQASSLAYPASYDKVISVAAVDAQGRQAYFSNSGEGLFISAPGVGIVSGYSGGKTVIGSGTSQAAALVSGGVAALLSRNYQAANIPLVLTSNAVRTGAPVTQVGAGILRLP